MFSAATLLSAFLLFQIQPLIARVILPSFGGTPAVWTTCMLFFQVLLCAGYGYGHLVVGRLSPRRQALVHGAVLMGSLAIIALGWIRWGAPMLPPRAQAASADHPQRAILQLLLLTVGAPYLVLATTGPLVQAWRARLPEGGSPYRLYALSNAGSLSGLIAYPLLVEPLLGLRAQTLTFVALYAVFVAATLLCAGAQARLASLGPQPDARQKEVPPSPGPRAYLAWLSLAAIASTLLLSVTNQLCQDVAAIPLLWVLPLALYLMSFILAFDRPRWYPRGVWMGLYALGAAAACWLLPRPEAKIVWQIVGWSLLLLSGCMICHGELQRARPHPRYLTGYYLALAVGGALGGLLVSVIAPAVFRGYFEVHLAIAAVAVAAVTLLFRDKKSAAWHWRFGAIVRVALPIAVLLLLWPLGRHVARSFTADTIQVERSFFGVLRVTRSYPHDPRRARRMLMHGRIIHGLELESDRHRPTAYYEEHSGIGRALRLHPRRPLGLKVGMCGLGVGTVAAYARPGDTFRFYEIDPDVVRLSRGEPPTFGFLAAAGGDVQVAVGDARVTLDEELRSRGPQRFDVLGIDAFSGDAIPVHLLTKEAVALYLQHLRPPDGVLALHISNRHVELFPVVRALAQELGLAYLVVDTTYDEQANDALDWESTWVLLARSKDALLPYGPPDDEPSDQVVRPFTDDYSNLVQLLKF
jgi:hypothetical protein